MSNSDTDTATRRRAVEEARDDWRTADREITRVRLLHNRLEALAERASRRVETDRQPVLDAFDRFGRTTDPREPTAAARRRQLRYLGEPLLERDGDETTAIRAARETVALDPPTATFVDRLAAFVDAADEDAPGWTGGGSVTAALEAVLGEEVPPVEYDGRLDALTTLFAAGVEAATVARDRRESALNEALAAYVEGTEAIPRDLDGQPIALLPVRLETRFVRSEGDRVVANTTDPTQLWVRVYPDQIHVDTHEPELTDGEVRAGEEFWTTVWYAAHPVLPDRTTNTDETRYYEERLPSRVRGVVDAVDPDGYSDDPADRYDEVKERAWGLLVERFGRERAAFVVHATAPVEPSDGADGEEAGAAARFSDALLAGVVGATDGSFVPLEPLGFPEVPRKPESWTRQPRAQLLPERWVAVAQWRTTDTDETGSERQRTFVGSAVREPLPVGPNPEQLELDGDPGRTVPLGMEWMVDFERAEAVGMALRIPGPDGDLSSLEGFDPNRGFTRLTVLGVRSSTTSDESTAALADLLDAHHYTDGLSVLPQGTPTNVYDTDSGYASADTPAESVRIECGPPLVSSTDRSDGDLLARALGFGFGDRDRHVFAHVEHADGTTQRDARHMNTVLWPVTLGYYAQHLLLPADSDAPFSGPLDSSPNRDGDGLPSPGVRLQWLDAYRRHFVRYVRSRGPLPAVRVGEQPYGVLPVAPATREAERAATSDRDRLPFVEVEFARRLREALDGFDVDVTVEAGRPLRDYVHPDVPTERYLDAGFSADELYQAGVSAPALLDAGVELATLSSLGVTAGELVDAADAGAMLDAGYEAPELLDAGYPVDALANADVPAAPLVRARVDTRTLLEAYPAGEVASAGVAPESLLSAGVTPETLVANGVPIADLRTAGVSAQSMRAAGRTAGELRAAGYPVEALRDAGFDAQTLLNAGFDARTLAAAGFRVTDLREAGASAGSLSTRFDASALRVAGYSAAELERAGFETAAVVEAGYTPAELLAAGYDAGSLVDAGVAPASLRNAGVSAKRLRAAGVPVARLRKAGFSASDLQASGASASELHAGGFTVVELKSAGFDAATLSDTGVDAGALHRAGYDAGSLVEAGVEPVALRNAGISANVLADAGLSREDLVAAGFGSTELAGVFTARDTTGGDGPIGTRVTTPPTFVERTRGRNSFDSGVGPGISPDLDLRDLNFGTDGGTAAAAHAHWVTGNRDHLVHDHLAGLVRTATTYWRTAVDGLEWTPEPDGAWPEYTESMLTTLLGRRARSSSLHLDGWFGLPNAKRSGTTGDTSPLAAYQGQMNTLSTALSVGGLADIGPRIAHLVRDGTVGTDVRESHLVGPHDATFLDVLANEPLEIVRRTGYRIDEDALGVRWNQLDVEAALGMVNDLDLTSRRWKDTAAASHTDSVVSADALSGIDLTTAEFTTAATLGIDWVSLGETVVPRYNANRRWEDLSGAERVALLSNALKNAGTDVSADVLADVTRAVRASATPASTPSIEKLVTMFALAMDYDDQPALLSSLLRLLTAFGTQHEYLAGRLRLGLLVGDETDASPERAWYWRNSPTAYSALFQEAPDALVADADAPAAVSPDDTYADLLYAAASDDPETTAIYPRISEYTDSLSYLSAAFDGETGHLPMAARRLLLLETLDLASHRLDAWWSSLATKRLFELRMVQEGRARSRPTTDGGDDRRPHVTVDIDADPSSWSVSPVAGTLVSAGLADDTDTDTGTTTTPLTPTFLHRATTTVAFSEAGAYDAGLFRHLPRDVELPAELEADPTLDELLMGVGAVDADPGVYIGAYGFVEDLRPDGVGTTPEYVHAPSLQHARTAAILRSADRAHGPSERGGSTVRDAITVDLSADRVREAKRLIDGVRRGQSLEELLGYRFERGLHERSSTSVNLVQYKDTFRRLFPVQKTGVVDGTDSDGEPIPTKLATASVVDGRAIVEAWPPSTASSAPERRRLLGELPSRRDEAFGRLDALVTELEDAVDAVSDLLLAEGVHQLGQGNFDAAGASLDTLAKGEVPPELTVTWTPRSAVGVTHRTVVVLDDPATATAPDAWQQETTVTVPSDDGDGADDDEPIPLGEVERLALDARARAEPSVNAWLGELFPAPDRIRCVATYRWEQDDETHTHRTVVTFADLDLSPLDALSVTATDPSARPGASELETRIGYLLARREASALPGPESVDLDLQLSFTETALDGEDSPDAVSVGEFLELARSVRDVLAETRPADAEDLAHPTDPSGPGYDESAVHRPTTDDDETARRRSLVARADEVQAGLDAVSGRLEDRLSVLMPGDGQTSTDGDTGAGSSSDTGAGEPGDDAASDERPGLPAQVDRFVEASRAFTDGVSLAALGEDAGGVEPGTFLDELGALAAALPAGSTTADGAAERVTVVAARQQTVSGFVSPPWDGPGTEPAPSGDAGESPLATGDGDGISLRSTAAGDDAAADEPSLRGGWTELAGPDDDSPSLRDLAARRATEPEPSEPPTLDVSVWSRSPTAWFTRTARVEADPDGSFEVTIDFDEVEPGTGFTVVATDAADGRVSYAASGRVVGETDRQTPESVVESSRTLRRLLRLAAVRERFAVRDGDDTAVLATDAGDGGVATDGADSAPTPADALHAAWSALDWSTLRRERGFAEEIADGSGTTLTDADLDAIDVLRALAGDDPAALDAAFDAVVGPLDRTGLAQVVDLVTVLVEDDEGTGAEHPKETARAYVAAGTAPTLRNRLERGVADPVRLRTDAPEALLDFHPRFASMLRRLDTASDGDHAARDVRALLDQQATLVERLDRHVDAPGDALRTLTALAYHGEGGRGDLTFATRLRSIGTAIGELDVPFEDGADAGARRARLGDALVALGDDLGRVYVRSPDPPLPDPAVQRSTFERRYRESLATLARRLEETDARHSALQTTTQGVPEAVRGAVLESLREVLVHASSFGVYGSTPESATGRTPADEAVLRDQAKAVVARIAVRMERAVPLRPTDDDLDTRPLDELVEDQRTRLEILLADAFVVLPPFRPTNGSELRATFGDGGLLDGADPLAAETWLQRSARAREHVADFSDARSYAETLGGRLSPSLTVGQLPHTASGETRWAGLDANPQPGVLSIVAQFDAGATAERLAGPAPVTGLFVDEWVEEVPSDEETTGIALQYDEPGTRPPQSILLAVPPIDRPWSVGALAETVAETAEFVKYRAVDPADLDAQDAVTTLLPALLFPKNSHSPPDAPSADFDMLTRYSPEMLLAVATMALELPASPVTAYVGDGSGGGGS